MGVRVLTDVPGEVDHPRQHHVEQDQVRGLLGECLARLLEVGCDLRGETLTLEEFRERFGDRGFVLDEQDLGLHGLDGSRAFALEVVPRSGRPGARRRVLFGALALSHHFLQHPSAA